MSRPQGWWRWREQVVTVLSLVLVMLFFAAMALWQMRLNTAFLEECREFKSEAECKMLWRLK